MRIARALAGLLGVALVASLGLAPSPVRGAIAFKEIAAQVGIAERVRTFAVAVADYDGDGAEDVFVVLHDPQAHPAEPPPRLWRNQGDGTFQDVAGPAFRLRDRHGCDWGDPDAHGDLDLFCSVGLTQSSVSELMQQLTYSFRDVSTAFGAADPSFHGRGRGGTFINADGDEFLDLYATRYYGSSGNGDIAADRYPNRLYLNVPSDDGGRKYVTAPNSWGLNQFVGAQKDNDACTQNVDYDADGDEDLLVCAFKTTILYENVGGRFVRNGLGQYFADAEIADLDGDEWLDLVTVGQNQLTVRPGSAGGFGAPSFTANVPWGINLAVGDFDGDDVNDVYAVGRCPDGSRADKPDFLFLNRPGSGFE
ncbi:MAG: VCBS repeat-containing protein, partial [Actinomycetota bacterium]|nr:VCBS repeat-containing protein [Actinomycetota bacterium]